MRTSKDTTCIYLERGVEDRALWEDINKVFVELYQHYPPKVAMKRYFTLYRFHQKLKEEAKED